MADQWQRVIFHADMDAFFAAVEQLDNPEIRGKPVIIGGTSGRGVVSTASYEARPFGVHSAMPMVTALRKCPGAVVISPRMDRYVEQSKAVMEVFDHYSPLVEPLSLDEAFLDMTGTHKLMGAPQKVAMQLKRDVTEATGGLIVSVGVAPNKFLAKVASDFRKPDGLTIVEPFHELEFLWPLPLKCLWGVGPKMQERLKDLGLSTIGDVAKVDETFLARRFKKMGRHIAAIARGIDDRPVVPHRDPKSIGAEYTLKHDIVGKEAIIPHLRRSASRSCQRLRKKGFIAGGVRVKLKTGDFELNTRQVLLTPPTDVTKTIFDVCLELLDQFDLSQPMRLVGMAVFDFKTGHHEQQLLFPSEDEKKEREIDKVLDGLEERFGKGVVKRGGN